MHAPAGGGGYGGAGYGSGQQPILFYSTASGHVQPQITSTAPQVFVSRRQQLQQQQAAASAAASPHLFPLQQPVGWSEPVNQAAVYAHPQYPPSHLAYAPPGPRPSEPYNGYASPYLPQLSASQQHQHLLQQQQQQQQMLMQQPAYPPHLFYGPQPTYSPQPQPQQPPVQQQLQQPLQLPQQQTAHQQAYQQPPPPQQSTQQQPPRHQPQQQPQPQQIPGGLYSPMTPLPQVPQPQLRQDQLNAQGQGQTLQPAAAAGPQRHHLPVIAEVAASATLLAADAQSSLAARRQQRSSSFSAVEQGSSPLLQQPAVPASPGAAIPLSAVAPGSPLDGPSGPVAVSPSPLSAAPFQPSPQNVTQYQALPKMRLQSLPPAPSPASTLGQTQQNPVVSPRGTDATRGSHPQQQLRKPLPDPVPASVPVSDLGGPALAPDIKKDINMFQLEGYAQHYFRTVKKGLFKRTVPVRELLVWSKGDINGGLLKHAKRETHKAAIKMFRNIQRYMGDREVKAGNRSGDQLALHIAVEADRVPELRDEVYIQICKQTTQNPSPKSNGLGWELLAIISSICYPTKDLEVHLVAYLNFYLGWNEENVRAIAHYCLRKLGQKGRPASLHRAITLQEIVRYKAAPFQKSWFGSCLLEQLEMPVQAPPPQTAATDIPLILPALTRAIEVAGGFKTEGLFRISGDGAEVSRLRAQVEGGDLTFNPRACPHDLASLFKAWLRELTPVVIVPELYQEFLNNCDQQPKLRELVAHLPPVHNKVLLHVLRFLQALTHADNVPATKMTASNIALLFSPLLLRCPSDDPMVMLENTKSESKAVATLLQIDWSAA